jgi:hypothetical protein
MFPDNDRMMRSPEEIQPEDLLRYLPDTLENIQSQTGLKINKLLSLLYTLQRRGLAQEVKKERRTFWYPAGLQKVGGSYG